MIAKNNIILRFLFILLILLIFPFPLTIIPKLDFIGDYLSSIYERVIPWIGREFFFLEDSINSQMNGSGDKTFDYLLLFLFFILAVCTTGIWMLLDKRKKTNEKLNYWLLTLIRYYLGYNMVFYGLIKIIKLQFPEIPFWRLLQPYGESSPMGLAWTFLGHSYGYNIFMGLAEFTGGTLLFHRRTKLLGSLILIPVIFNIVAVNFFFDIPVKLFSLELLLLAILILIPDFNRLSNVILYNNTIEPKSEFYMFSSKKWKRGKILLKLSLIFLVFFSSIKYVVESHNSGGIKAKKPMLYGLYTTNVFISNHDTIPPKLTENNRWKNIFIEYPGTIQFARMDNSRFGLRLHVDTLNQKMELTEMKGLDKKYILDYIKTDTGLILSGVFRSDTILCETYKLNRDDFRLTSRGFNWINERPYNR